MASVLSPWTCLQAEEYSVDGGKDCKVKGVSVMTNPVIWADAPDPDVIRVGDDYYMVTTTMHLMPGCPVMHSKGTLSTGRQYPTCLTPSTTLRNIVWREGQSMAKGNESLRYGITTGCSTCFSLPTTILTNHMSIPHPIQRDRGRCIPGCPIFMIRRFFLTTMDESTYITGRGQYISRSWRPTFRE